MLHELYEILFVLADWVGRVAGVVAAFWILGRFTVRCFLSLLKALFELLNFLSMPSTEKYKL